MEQEEAPRVMHLPAGRARGLGRPIVSRRGSVSIEPGPVAVRSKGPAARPWEPSGSIDVEQLAIWAFRDQRAHRNAAVGLHAVEAMVEGLETHGRSSDGCGALADIEHLGCRIDRRVGKIVDHIHPAAEAVAVLVGDVSGGGLVRHYAALGGRPEDWREPKAWWRPVVWVKPGIEAQTERLGRGNSPLVCRIIPTVTKAELERRRDQYRLWHEGLGQLAWRLSMRALGFTVLPPSAPAAPWLDAAAGSAR